MKILIKIQIGCVYTVYTGHSGFNSTTSPIWIVIQILIWTRDLVLV